MEGNVADKKCNGTEEPICLFWRNISSISINLFIVFLFDLNSD